MSEPTATIVRADQSPLNAARWLVTLSCGCETWVTQKTRPKVGRPMQGHQHAPQSQEPDMTPAADSIATTMEQAADAWEARNPGRGDDGTGKMEGP